MNINFKLRYKIRQILSYFLSALMLFVGYPANSKVLADEINLDGKVWSDVSSTDNIYISWDDSILEGDIRKFDDYYDDGSKRYPYWLSGASNLRYLIQQVEQGNSYENKFFRLYTDFNINVTTTTTTNFEGSGTENDPYKISNAADLRYLSKIVKEGNNCKGKFFQLTNGIDFNKNLVLPIGTKDKPFKGTLLPIDINIPYDTMTMTPIGTKETPFMGTFDGNNFKIKGLNISDSEGKDVGFFGYIKDATIKNVYFDESCVLSSTSNGIVTDMFSGDGGNGGNVGIICNASGNCNISGVKNDAIMRSKGADGFDDQSYDRRLWLNSDYKYYHTIHNTAIICSKYFENDDDENPVEPYIPNGVGIGNIAGLFNFASDIDGTTGLPTPLDIQCTSASRKNTEEYRFYVFGKNESTEYNAAKTYLEANGRKSNKKYNYNVDDARISRLFINENGSDINECVDLKLEDGKYDYAVILSSTDMPARTGNNLSLTIGVDINYSEVGMNGGGNGGNAGSVGFIAKTSSDSNVVFDSCVNGEKSILFSEGGQSGGGRWAFSSYYIMPDSIHRTENHGGNGGDVGSLVGENNGNTQMINCLNMGRIYSAGGGSCDISDVNGVFSSYGGNGGNAGGFIGSANGNSNQSVIFKGKCVNAGKVFSGSAILDELANYSSAGREILGYEINAKGSTGTGVNGGNAGGFIGQSMTHVIFSQFCQNIGSILADGSVGGSSGNGQSTGTGAANGGSGGNAGGLVGLILNEDVEISEDASINIERRKNEDRISANGGTTEANAGPWYCKYGNTEIRKIEGVSSGNGGNGGCAGGLFGNIAEGASAHNRSKDITIDLSLPISAKAGSGYYDVNNEFGSNTAINVDELKSGQVLLANSITSGSESVEHPLLSVNNLGGREYKSDSSTYINNRYETADLIIAPYKTNGKSGLNGFEGKYVGSSHDTGNPQYGILVDKSSWGKEVNNNGVINYVDDAGTTSAEVDKEDIIWLKEESIDHYDPVTDEPVITSAWYGLDNSKATFKRGSRFWVRWLSEDTDKEEYMKYYEQLDDEWKEKAKKEKLWIFLTGVTDPNGKEYTNLDQEIDYNIQLGNDWDKKSIFAVYIANLKDEKLNPHFVNISFPAGNSEFAKLKLKHFSPYVIGEGYDVSSYVKSVKSSKNKNKEKTNFNDYQTSDSGDIITATNLIILYSVLILASWIFRKQT